MPYLALIDRRFDFAAPKRRIVFLTLTYNMLAKKHSDLLELGFLTVVLVVGKLRLSSVIYSRV